MVTTKKMDFSYVLNTALVFGAGILTGVLLRRFSGGRENNTILNTASRTARLAAIRATHLSRSHKLVLVVRNDLNMNKGKIAAQCAHAAVMCYKNALVQDPENLEIWEATGCAKICLKLQNESEGTLQALKKKAKEQNLVTGLVCDAGHTQVAPGTITVLGIGPAPVEEINKVTGQLKLL